MTDFARVQNAAVRAAIAGQAGCDIAAFACEELTVVQRPEPPLWPFTGMMATFGTGTVVSVTEPFVDWARGLRLEKHFYALGLSDAMTREGERQGVKLEGWPPGLTWSLARMPDAPIAPRGLRLARVDKDWMTARQKDGVFHNACGAPEQAHRTWRNKFACALLDENDAPAAVAGVFDTAGLWEIGLDVARAHRGQGLAPLVVAAATRAILDEGKTPYYACGVGNIRSQRTALASGFVPACGVSFIVEAGLGI